MLIAPHSAYELIPEESKAADFAELRVEPI
jgi:hypothetical protein